MTTEAGTGLSPAEVQRRASHAVVWSTLSSVISLPLAVVVSVVIARSLGPTEYGRFAYLAFIVPLVLNVLDFGVAMSATRTTSATFAAGNLEATRDVLSKTLGWNMLRLPIVLAVVLALARPPAAAAAALIVGCVLLTIASGAIHALQAENRGATAAKFAFVGGLVSAAASIVVAAAGGSAAAVWVATYVAAAALVPAWLHVLSPELRRASLTPRFPRNLPTGFWRFGISTLALVTISTLVFSRSEIVVLDAFGDERAIALFALAYGLSQRLTTPIDTLLGPLIPALSAVAGAHPERIHAAFGRALRLAATGAAFMAGTATVGTMLVAPVLFGPEFEGTGQVFLALAAVSLLQSAAQPYLALGQAIGRPGLLVRAYAIALVVNVVVAIGLIPGLGVWGAVIANAAGALTALGLMSLGVSKQSVATRPGVPALKLLALACGSAAAAYVAGALVATVNDGAGAIAAYVVGTVTFATLAYVSGGLLPQRDVAPLTALLPRRLRPLVDPWLSAVPAAPVSAPTASDSVAS